MPERAAMTDMIQAQGHNQPNMSQIYKCLMAQVSTELQKEQKGKFKLKDKIEILPSKHYCNRKLQACHEEATVTNLLDVRELQILYLIHKSSTTTQACIEQKYWSRLCGLQEQQMLLPTQHQDNFHYTRKAQIMVLRLCCNIQMEKQFKESQFMKQ